MTSNLRHIAYHKLRLHAAMLSEIRDECGRSRPACYHFDEPVVRKIHRVQIHSPINVCLLVLAGMCYYQSSCTFQQAWLDILPSELTQLILRSNEDLAQL